MTALQRNKHVQKTYQLPPTLKGDIAKDIKNVFSWRIYFKKMICHEKLTKKQLFAWNPPKQKCLLAFKKGRKKEHFETIKTSAPKTNVCCLAFFKLLGPASVPRRAARCQRVALVHPARARSEELRPRETEKLSWQLFIKKKGWVIIAFGYSWQCLNVSLPFCVSALVYCRGLIYEMFWREIRSNVLRCVFEICL